MAKGIKTTSPRRSRRLMCGKNGKKLSKDISLDSYKTKTFIRKAFSDQDRKTYLLRQARAEANHLGETFDEDKSMEVIDNMGVKMTGIHARHVIPYSDISETLRIATSKGTISDQGESFVKELRDKVTDLVKLIGSPGAQNKWATLYNGQVDDDLLTNPRKRELVKQVYFDMAHSSGNMFLGSGPANMALANRPDSGLLARGVLGSAHVDSLINWWYDTMSHLGVNPREEESKIYDTVSKKYVKARLHSHDYSRTLGVVRGDADELPWVSNQ